MSDQHELPMGIFGKGWKLLLLQPWGWRYRGMVEDPVTKQMTVSEEAKTQMEFYYSKLKWATGAAWMEVAQRFAEGEKWPSVQELRLALQHVNGKYVKALPEPAPQYEPMPEEVRARLSGYVGRSM